MLSNKKELEAYIKLTAPEMHIVKELTEEVVKKLKQKNVRLPLQYRVAEDPLSNKKELEAYIKLTAPEMHIIKNLAKKE